MKLANLYVDAFYCHYNMFHFILLLLFLYYYTSYYLFYSITITMLHFILLFIVMLSSYKSCSALGLNSPFWNVLFFLLNSQHVEYLHLFTLLCFVVALYFLFFWTIHSLWRKKCLLLFSCFSLFAAGCRENAGLLLHTCFKVVALLTTLLFLHWEGKEGSVRQPALPVYRQATMVREHQRLHTSTLSYMYSLPLELKQIRALISTLVRPGI